MEAVSVGRTSISAEYSTRVTINTRREARNKACTERY